MQWEDAAIVPARLVSRPSNTIALKFILHLTASRVKLLIQYHSYRTSFILCETHVQLKITLNARRYRSHHLVTLSSPESIRKLLQRTSDKFSLLPQVGGQVSVCVADGDEGGLQGVLERFGRTGGGSVDIIDASELEKTLDGGGGDETGTTGSWNKLRKSV